MAEQTNPQTAALTPDKLGSWRTSLTEVRALVAEVTKLAALGLDLGSELRNVTAEAQQVADLLVADPEAAGSLEPERELGSLTSREAGLNHQIAALDRRLLPILEKLQKKLVDDLEAFGRLNDARKKRVLELETVVRLSGVEVPLEADTAAAEQLAKSSRVYGEACRLSFPGISFAWSRPLTDTVLSKWGEKRQETSTLLIAVAKEFLSAGKQLLEHAVFLPEVPLFTLPPPPVPEQHPEWNLPIGAEVTVSERLLEASGKKREELTPAMLDILARSEAGNNSYLKESRPYAVGTYVEP